MAAARKLTAWTPRGYVVAVGSGTQSQVHVVTTRAKDRPMKWGDPVELTFRKGDPFATAAKDVTATGIVVGTVSDIDANAPLA